MCVVLFNVLPWWGFSPHQISRYSRHVQSVRKPKHMKEGLAQGLTRALEPQPRPRMLPPGAALVIAVWSLR